MKLENEKLLCKHIAIHSHFYLKSWSRAYRMGGRFESSPSDNCILMLVTTHSFTLLLINYHCSYWVRNVLRGEKNITYQPKYRNQSTNTISVPEIGSFLQGNKIILRLIPGLKPLWYRNWICQKSTFQPLPQKVPCRDGFIETNLCYLNRKYLEYLVHSKYLVNISNILGRQRWFNIKLIH